VVGDHEADAHAASALRAEFDADVARGAAVCAGFVEQDDAGDGGLGREGAGHVFLEEGEDFRAARLPVGVGAHGAPVGEAERVGQEVRARERVEVGRQFAGFLLPRSPLGNLGQRLPHPLQVRGAFRVRHRRRNGGARETQETQHRDK
jgi:hypothetical protein